jgi:hypothetical protein
MLQTFIKLSTLFLQCSFRAFKVSAFSFRTTNLNLSKKIYGWVLIYS